MLQSKENLNKENIGKHAGYNVMLGKNTNFLVEHAMTHYPTAPDIIPQYSEIEKILDEDKGTNEIVPVGSRGIIVGAFDMRVVSKPGSAAWISCEKLNNFFCYIVHFHDQPFMVNNFIQGAKIKQIIT